MRSNYKRLGDYIQEVTLRNTELNVNNLLGININKFFMPSVANVVGTDMSKYKIVKKRQFACNRMHVGRDKRLPVALWDEIEDIIVSPAYDVFEVIDEEVLFPEYLMMWFSRKEFDRNAWFYTDADVRGGLSWNDFCNFELPVPSIEKQREIVKEYKVLQDRISLNNKLIEKLEDTAQTIYKQWFVDFEFPDENGKPYKSSGGEMELNTELDKEIPRGWELKTLEEVVTITRGASPRPIDDYMSRDNSGMPWVKIADATASITKYLTSTKEFISMDGVKKSRKVEKGTLILSNSASPGLPKFMMIEACVHDGWLIFNDYQNISKEFIYNFLLINREDILSSGNGSVFNNLKTEILKSYKIIIPNDKILNKVNELFRLIDKEIMVAAKTDYILMELSAILFTAMAKGDRM